MNSNLNKIKILVVDDNRIIRQLLRLTFSDSKYELFEADGCESSLPIVIKEKPDYILLDVMMYGELDGYQICSMIKSWHDTRDCKVIILSARGQQEDLEQGMNVGADYYVTKPFSPGNLLKLIEKDSAKLVVSEPVEDNPHL